MPDQRLPASVRRLRLTLTFLLLAVALPAVAVPNVATDVTPVHSLVSQVMEGVGEPRLVIQRGASPHSYAMRPSEAAALENANVVFWVGEELTPWLGHALGNLAPDARQVALLHAEGTLRHAFRERVLTETAGHENHDHADEHGHDAEEHDTHGHDDHAEEVDDHHGHDHAGHAHGGIDPHAWLDPVNARRWLAVIAETLAEEDPANAPIYRRNAEAGQAEIDALLEHVQGEVSPVHEQAFIVFHDAYQYYERRFDMNTVGAISLSDATDPSPAHLAEIREIVGEYDVQCVFAEPQFNPALVDTVLDGTSARTGVLDPLGSDIATGPDFYPTLIRQLTDRLVSCLAGS
ncbi:zinc ABC transporter substrate-binding protein [Spiribacter insolitus]|uniref:High-affinity zinc uptake system protein ZnuA n=1 Tax=Spiribacter insolitus TaxID=3122417 RepID=A0ABV3TBC4_9GAMM